jgi:fatty acid desaturase
MKRAHVVLAIFLSLAAFWGVIILVIYAALTGG